MSLTTVEAFESGAAIVLLVTPETEAGNVMKTIDSYHVDVENDDAMGHLRIATCRKEALQFVLKDVALVTTWCRLGEASIATLDISEDLL